MAAAVSNKNVAADGKPYQRSIQLVSMDAASSNQDVVEEECCRLNNERERNEVTSIMKANPYVGALLLKYLSQLGHQADPDDAFNACAPIIPSHWLVPSGGSGGRILCTVPFEDQEANRESMADIRRRMTRCASP